MEYNLVVNANVLADNHQGSQFANAISEFRLVRTRQQALNLLDDALQFTIHVKHGQLIQHTSLQMVL